MTEPFDSMKEELRRIAKAHRVSTPYMTLDDVLAFCQKQIKEYDCVEDDLGVIMGLELVIAFIEGRYEDG